MFRFIVRRLVTLVVALFAISVLIFMLLRVLPGDLALVMAGVNASPERVAHLRVELGLNRPLTTQYLDWFGSLLHGDLGVSQMTGRPVTVRVAQRASITFPLIGMGLLVALGIGIPLGYKSVIARSSRVRSAMQLIAIIGGSVPALWAGLVLILLFARGTGLIGILPSQGFPLDAWQEPGKAFVSLLLPALTVGIIVGASIMRYTRSALMEQMSSDVISMAMACGYTRKQAMLHVGLRLAMPQLVSVIGLTFAEMITGVMVIENLFALPGIGSGLINDVGHRDLIAVQSELFLLAAFFLVIGLLVDITHRVLDPRLKG
ncbi:ABC transporter, permease protein [Bifidobacterium dolichotidis]|uniref:ABC transporter, permease protein n=1 Tax=Bifidobacterium dolichotidis TaxID=2306976 RepID=A0A430FPU2_9BIFI|nr:ABC transporter permease [Bifidobacterium dolichotidis]RSX54836.1 ABC transporter, permease protein [Bifidobacterium dolichotidis]